MSQHAIEILSQIWHSSLESVARYDSVSANNFSKTTMQMAEIVLKCVTQYLHGITNVISNN